MAAGGYLYVTDNPRANCTSSVGFESNAPSQNVPKTFTSAKMGTYTIRCDVTRRRETQSRSARLLPCLGCSRSEAPPPLAFPALPVNVSRRASVGPYACRDRCRIAERWRWRATPVAPHPAAHLPGVFPGGARGRDLPVLALSLGRPDLLPRRPDRVGDPTAGLLEPNGVPPAACHRVGHGWI